MIAASIWFVVIVRAVSKCLESRIGAKRVQAIWQKTDFQSMLVRLFYYSFYPCIMSVFFQFSFHASLEAGSDKLSTARILSFIAVLFLILELIWFTTCGVLAYKEVYGNQKLHRAIETVGCLQSTLLGKVGPLTEYWRSSYELWFVFKVLKMGASALIVSSIFNPKPFQPVLIFVIVVTYYLLLCKYKVSF